MTKAGRYYTMDLHLSPNTALPIWNNKQTIQCFQPPPLSWADHMYFTTRWNREGLLCCRLPIIHDTEVEVGRV